MSHKANAAATAAAAAAAKPPRSSPVIAIRFSAGTDSVEDVAPTNNSTSSVSSLSSSPQLSNVSDDSSWRKDFGGFFSRKRSNSIETLPPPPSDTSASSSSITSGGEPFVPSSSASTSTSAQQQTVTAVITSPPSSGAGSVGTWKLIKGRVTQAMEEITSSSSAAANSKAAAAAAAVAASAAAASASGASTAASTAASAAGAEVGDAVAAAAGDGDEDDDDEDSATLNSSISDDFNEAAARTSGGGGYGSDQSDDMLLHCGNDADAYLMKRSFDALRAHSHAAAHSSQTASTTATAAVAIASAAATTRPSTKQRSTSSLLAKLGRLGTEASSGAHEWPGRLRRRHHDRKHHAATAAAAATSSSSSTGGGGGGAAIDDIESGVEITEEMTHQMLHDTTTITTTQTATTPTKATATGAAAAAAACGHQLLDASFAGTSDVFRDVVDDENDENGRETLAMRAASNSNGSGSGIGHLLSTIHSVSAAALQLLVELWLALPRRGWLAVYGGVLAVAWLLQVPAFVGGMLVCWCAMAAAQAVGEAVRVVGVRRVRERFEGDAGSAGAAGGGCANVHHGPQRGPFSPPDYTRLPPLEVPSSAASTASTATTTASAHLLVYSGWLNEAHTYDPANHRPSQTRTVHLRLDGTALRVSSVATGGVHQRIARHATWTEPPLWPGIATFTRHRAYEVLGAQVQLLPVGLARKRHFSRKYPIEVVMRRGDEELPAVEVVQPQQQQNDGDDTEMESSERNFGDAIMFSNLQRLHFDREALAQADASPTKSFTSSGLSTTISTATATIITPATVSMAPSSASGQHNINNSGSTATSAGSATLPTTTTTSSAAQRSAATAAAAAMSGLPQVSRLLLFARTDREKEDWYRRLVAASRGWVIDRRSAGEEGGVDGGATIESTDEALTPHSHAAAVSSSDANVVAADATAVEADVAVGNGDEVTMAKAAEEESGVLLMTSCAYRGPVDYVRFMEHYKRACAIPKRATSPYSTQNTSVSTTTTSTTKKSGRHASPASHKSGTSKRPSRREQKKSSAASAAADELWRGVDRSLAATPAHLIPPQPHHSIAETTTTSTSAATSTLLSPASPQSAHAALGSSPSTSSVPPLSAHGAGAGLAWANVLAGRAVFALLHDRTVLAHIQQLLQRKLSALRLPGFMDEVRVTDVHLGDRPPLVHRVSAPLLDERGTWLDADVTYEGLMHMTIATKLNLLRLRRTTQQQQQQADYGDGGTAVAAAADDAEADSGGGSTATSATAAATSATNSGAAALATAAVSPTAAAAAAAARRQLEAICDSDAESSGASSSEEDGSPTHQPVYGGLYAMDGHPVGQMQVGAGAAGSAQGAGATADSSGSGGKKFLRIVDRIAASNLFQSAAEISYIQKAMENMSTDIRLRVELKGLVARCCLNLPAPPSDRVWLGFRGPPRLWLAATPALGDHTVDWSIVTNAIEAKLCEEVAKYLVYPNMVDLVVPLLGASGGLGGGGGGAGGGDYVDGGGADGGGSTLDAASATMATGDGSGSTRKFSDSGN